MEKNYGPIHDGFGNPFARDYNLEGCLRCGAAVPAHKTFRDQHEKWHAHDEARFATIDKNFNLIQERLNMIAKWLNGFKERNS